MVLQFCMSFLFSLTTELPNLKLVIRKDQKKLPELRRSGYGANKGHKLTCTESEMYPNHDRDYSDVIHIC